MRVGCGSATIGIFAKQWQGHVDEVIVVDDHITGVLTRASGRPLPRDAARRHPRARAANRRPAAISRSPIPASAGAAPTSPIPSPSSRSIDPKTAWPGMRLLMVSTTGEDAGYFILDESLRRVAAEMPDGRSRRWSSASARIASRR